MPEVSAYAPDGVPEVTAGDDLVDFLLAVADLADGEIVAGWSRASGMRCSRGRPSGW
jgi:hypothetical protein